MTSYDTRASATALAAIDIARGVLTDANRSLTAATAQNDRAQSAEARISATLASFKVPHRWVGTRLDILGPEGFVDGADLVGPPGSPGSNGDSAYQIWLAAGNTGSISDFLQALRGNRGDPGPSVYEFWLAQGNVGTEAEFLASLVGPTGASAYQAWLDEGNTGSAAEFIEALRGPPGLDGRNGTRWYATFNAAPSAGLGYNDDFAIDLVTGNVYEKASGTWQDSGYSLIGPPGAGSGDFSGPAGAVTDNIILFASGTGKLGKDSGKKLSDLATAGHGHSDATTGVSGFMSATDKTKLNGIASGATANSSDSTLLNRANHTGTQAISTIDGLSTALADKADADDVAMALVSKVDAVDLATVATSNSYVDLDDKPNIPSVPADIGAAPVSHGHIISDVSGLQTALDGKQPLASLLTNIAALTMIADRLIYGTGAGTVGLATLTSHARSLLAAADGAVSRSVIGAEAAANKGANNGYAGLDSGGKVPVAQLPAAVLGAMSYQGTWNANTNSPTIPAASSGNKGYFYKVSTAGTTSVSGISDWGVGDWIVSNGTSWDKIDNTDAVTSVAGLVGAITGSSLKTAIGLLKGDVGLGSVDNTADADKPVSTAQAAAIKAKPETIVLACSDLTSAISAGTNKAYLRMPYAFTLTAVKASFLTAQASGNIFTVDVNKNGTTVLSTKLTIDNTEKTSATAATAAVISVSSFSADDEVTIDVDQIGNGSARGLEVTLVGYQT
ncbi:hypothetical protein [Chelatococcus asaccharovorans]|uniref:Uncharacterized protein n=1 Tax=Chelatococcus asaccharovorans TaxID=28210 RepID=A0A2V3UB54_9HYPH|nr:hypothetical protein [Chelatococcus asaccharovorans]MBS7703326.1 hypothetical protein [Chelatococcus asaccharovorans]PXW61659.1 hypothetical protein C7450_103176 [Chelatococcus asaccharovorans]